MAIYYTPVPKKNNINADEPVQYYPCAVAKAEIDFESLCEIVSSQCSASRADCYLVITALTDVLKDQLLQGNIVRMGNLGSFRTTLSGLPSESADKVSRYKIKKCNLAFKPSKNIQNALKEAVFLKKKV
jgi:predicted histone-like DNA-binding protein